MRIFVPMEPQELKTKVTEWANSIGHGKAVSRLYGRDVSMSVSEKLISGRYPSTPGRWLTRILTEEMAKDGVEVSTRVVS